MVGNLIDGPREGGPNPRRGKDDTTVDIINGVQIISNTEDLLHSSHLRDSNVFDRKLSQIKGG